MQHPWNLVMAGNKTATLTLRIEPTLKEALRNAALQEHRSIANMIEVMILDYCENHGHAVPDTAEKLSRGDRSK